MDMSKVFLITDLDGTLLPDNKVLSEGDIKAIKCFVSDGGRFSIATGRTIQASRRYINALDVNMPVILYNGSLIILNAVQKYFDLTMYMLFEIMNMKYSIWIYVR